MSQKLILVIGGTGAQGIAVIDALLIPQGNGDPSPYTVRVLTRNPSHGRAQTLKEKGCELVQGSIMDFESIERALQGAYGAFFNTDGFTVGEKAEVFAGLRIFELAKHTKGLKHYVWSSLDYLQIGGFDPKYRCGHCDGKGRVTEFLKAQTSNPDEMIWTSFTNGPYMDMLFGGLFRPIIAKDGSAIWAFPLGEGRIPLISLKDLGLFARWVYDHPTEVSGRDLSVVSHLASGSDIANAFTTVTGRPGRFIPLTLDEYFGLNRNADLPVASEDPNSLSIRQNFTGAWNIWKDNLLVPTRDMEWLKSIHPGIHTVESWMREVGYDGSPGRLLKNMEDNGDTRISLDLDKISTLLSIKL